MSVRWSTCLIFCLSVGTLLGDSGGEIAHFELSPQRDEAVYRSSESESEFILIDFFAHWCKPCLKLTPEVEAWVQRLHAKNPQFLLELLPVNVDNRKPAKTLKFLERVKLEHSWVDDDGRLFAEIGENRGLPLVVLLQRDASDKQLEVLYLNAGKPDWSMIEHLISERSNGGKR